MSFACESNIILYERSHLFIVYLWLVMERRALHQPLLATDPKVAPESERPSTEKRIIVCKLFIRGRHLVSCSLVNGSWHLQSQKDS
jgi:hypothetical protein